MVVDLNPATGADSDRHAVRDDLVSHEVDIRCGRHRHPCRVDGEKARLGPLGSSRVDHHGGRVGRDAGASPCRCDGLARVRPDRGTRRQGAESTHGGDGVVQTAAIGQRSTRVVALHVDHDVGAAGMVVNRHHARRAERHCHEVRHRLPGREVEVGDRRHGDPLREDGQESRGRRVDRSHVEHHGRRSGGYGLGAYPRDLHIQRGVGCEGLARVRLAGARTSVGDAEGRH